jgi:hypothetical protein
MLTDKDKSEIDELVARYADEVEDVLNTALRKIVDNELGLDPDKDQEKWEEALEYAREKFFEV